MHLDGKENEKFFSCIKRTCRRLKLKEALQDFLVPLKQGTIRGFNPNSTPDCTISSRVSPIR